MTDRLATLLRRQVDDLTVPPPPVSAILDRGRSRRRRQRSRRITGGVAALTGLAALGSLTVPGLLGTTPEHALDPATTAKSTAWAIAQGSRLHLGTGATAEVPGQVKAIYYTSAGMLVRVGATAATDAPDSSYWLAHDDGTVSDFELRLGDRVPGTDPTLPYLAYAEAGADQDHWTVVLRDVRTGEVAASIPIEGRFSWGGWVAPPVALSGEHVYVGVDDTLLDIRWRTGEVIRTGITTHLPETRGGVDIVHDDGRTVRLIDAASEETLLTLPYHPTADDAADELVWPRLSPDGSQVLLTPTGICDQDGRCSYESPEATVIELATGRRHTVELAYGEYGWSATGELILVDGDSVRTCEVTTWRCATTPVDLDDHAPLLVSGNGYES